MITERANLQQELKEDRLRTDRLFALLSPDAIYERPIPERHRLIFYVGHIEAFDWNQLCRWTLDLPAFHATFDQLFEAGIDPTVGHVSRDSPSDWPKLDEVQRYNERVRQEVDRVLDHVPEWRFHMAIEHRLMHAETTAYLLHHLDSAYTCKPALESLCLSGEVATDEMVDIPDGTATLGRQGDEGFGWDNEFGQHDESVPAFAISRYNITNEQYVRFVEEEENLLCFGHGKANHGDCGPCFTMCRCRFSGRCM